MNTDPASKPGSHWVAVYIDSNKRGEYFDSYGRRPGIPALVQLLNKNCRSWEYNQQPVQGLFSSVCGHYCVYFLLQRVLTDIPMSEILQIFDSECLEENDQLITDWLNENFDLDTETYNIEFLLNQVCHALLEQ